MSSLPNCPKCGNTVFSHGNIVAGSLGHIPVIYCKKCGCIISVIYKEVPNTVIITNPIINEEKE